MTPLSQEKGGKNTRNNPERKVPINFDCFRQKKRGTVLSSRRKEKNVVLEGRGRAQSIGSRGKDFREFF